MKHLRVLALMHPDFVPPDSTDGYTPKQINEWKTEYDAHGPAREKAGLKEVSLLHTLGDENDVTLLFEAKDLAKAKEFSGSSDLKQAMDKAGVVGKPEVNFLEN